MNILVINGGRESIYLVRRMLRQGHSVRFLSGNREACRMFAESFDRPAYCGDAMNMAILGEACDGSVDLAAAVGTSESENFVICELAKKKYHVPKTISIIRNCANIPFFMQSGIDRFVCGEDLISSIADDEATENSLRQFFPEVTADMSVREITLEPRSKVLHKKVWEVPMQQQSLVACIIRDGGNIIPHGNTELKAGDRLILLASRDQIDATANLFA